jgi:hypothetical protein
MYTNVGKKIKTLAKVICALGIISSFIIGIIMIAGGSSMGYYYGNNNALIFPGLVVIILGSVLSWVSSLALYAFGEMTENVSAIKNSLEK